MVAGATALTALTHQACAQSSDALLNKLVDKGVLTTEEAQQLREEDQQEYTNRFKSSFDKMTGTPSWVTGFKFSGDFRGRYEQFATPDNNNYADRTRFRYRLRVGVVANMLDSLEVGFGLASGDAAQGSSGQGNPLSENTTLQNNGTGKGIYIDQAYGKWTAIHSDEWQLATTIGKMSNPFNFTAMLFDPDYNPEGAAITGSHTINDQQSIAFTGAAFVLDEESGSTRDPFMAGGQVLLNSKWSDKLSSSVGVGAFQFGNTAQLTAANVPYQNQGNTRNAAGGLVNNYNPIIADANTTYKFDRFPLYPGVFPVKIGGEFVNNPAASDNNNGYWAGVTFGKAGKKHTWDLSYRYEYLEANAWYDQITDDDNGAFYQFAPVGAPAGTGTGIYGGTNVKGHLIKGNYSITDSLTLTLTCYITDLISNPATQNGIDVEPNNEAIHAMADITWKF